MRCSDSVKLSDFLRALYLPHVSIRMGAMKEALDLESESLEEDPGESEGDPVTSLIERHARERTLASKEATDEEIESLCATLCAAREYTEKEKAVLPMMIKTLLNIRLREISREREA
jgi:hypothetical protein